MNRVVFIDANVPIYGAGREPRYREPCGRILMMVPEHACAFVTDAEVLENFAELMHGRVERVYADDILQAGRLADELPGVSARDLVHLAVMQRLNVSRIVTADTDFDLLPEAEILAPSDVDVADLLRETGVCLVAGNQQVGRKGLAEVIR